MPKVSHPINSFVGGELAPEFQGRTDTAKYATGAHRIENFIVHPEGGAHRRPGSRFVTGAHDSTKKSRLIPFVFSDEQAYVLEFTEFAIRVFASESLLPVAASQSAVTVSSTPMSPNLTTNEFNPTVVIAPTENEGLDHGYVDEQGPFQFTAGDVPTGFSTGTDYYIVSPSISTWDAAADVVVGTETIDTTTAHGYDTEMGPFRLSTDGDLGDGLAGNVDYYVEAVDATHIRLRLTPGGAAVNIIAVGIGTTTMAPTGDYTRAKYRLSLTPGGARVDATGNSAGDNTLDVVDPIPLEIPSPYAESELYDIQVAQSADFLFIVHPDHPPVQLTRSSNLLWSLNFTNFVDGPYLSQNVDSAITMTPTATTGYTKLTAVGRNFTSDDIGRLMRLKQVATWAIVRIHEINVGGNLLVAQVEVISDFTDLSATPTFRMGSWYPANFPRAVSFFEQRLGFAGEANTPQTFHGSETSSFNSFSPTQLDGSTLATNAVQFTIGTNQVNAIRWMALGSQLVLGTSSALFTVRGTFEGEPIEPGTIQVQRLTSYGALDVQALVVSDQMTYLTANSRRLRSFRTTPDSGIAETSDVTLLAGHIFGTTSKVTNMTYQQDRQQVLWAVRDDGVLAAVTYVPDQEVFAWHRHTIGGSFGAGDAVVESVATIPSPDGTHDQVWLSVKRTVDGATARHIEFFEDEWLSGTDTEMLYMDSAPAAFSGAAQATFEGLDHLEGETVQVLANGAVHPDAVVSSGSITLNAEYTDVVAGLGYVSEIESLRLEPPDPEGKAMGKVARVDHIVLRLFESIGGEMGVPDAVTFDPIIDRGPTNGMGQSVPAFTGDKKIAFAGPFQREKKILIRQSQPLPFNLLSMNILVSTGPR